MYYWNHPGRPLLLLLISLAVLEFSVSDGLEKSEVDRMFRFRSRPNSFRADTNPCMWDGEYPLEEECGGHGYCEEMQHCLCHDNWGGDVCSSCNAGWEGNACKTKNLCMWNGENQLEEECDGRGECVGNGDDRHCVCHGNWGGDVCSSCNTGWEGVDCKTKNLCMWNGENPLEEECDGHGNCEGKGDDLSCVCRGNWGGEACSSCIAGWDGDDCKTKNLCMWKGENTLEEECDGHGDCEGMGDDRHCVCRNNWSGDVCSSCNAGWDGDDCKAKNLCMWKGENTLEEECDGHGDCEGMGDDRHCVCRNNWSGDVCISCNAGWDGDDCKTKNLCMWKGENTLEEECDGHGDCEGMGDDRHCVCRDNWDGAVCNECKPGREDDCAKENPCMWDGDTVVQKECDGHGQCDGNGDDRHCVCRDNWDGAVCNECKEWWEGDNCTKKNSCKWDGDNVLQKECDGHGECERKGDVRHCVCRDNWDGDVCNTCTDQWEGNDCNICKAGWEDGCAKKNPCMWDGDTVLQKECDGHGECQGNGDDRHCVCRDNWGGDVCTTCKTGWEEYNCTKKASCLWEGDNVLEAKCAGHGDCQGEAEETHCICRDNWVGTACSTCKEGWTGDDCNSTIPCQWEGEKLLTEEEACSGHGTCKVVGEEYKCDCAGKWTGNDCSTCQDGWLGSNCSRRNPCFSDSDTSANKQCGGNSSCIPSAVESDPSSFLCVCRNSEEVYDKNLRECIGVCQGNVCNHGECHPTKGGYICRCHPGYMGDKCNEEDNDLRKAKVYILVLACALGIPLVITFIMSVVAICKLANRKREREPYSPDDCGDQRRTIPHARTARARNCD